MHLGIIADGNRRWAKKNGLSKIEGHKRGLERIEELVGAAAHEDMDLQGAFSLYALTANSIRMRM